MLPKHRNQNSSAMSTPDPWIRLNSFAAMFWAAILFTLTAGANTSLPVITKDVVILGGGASGTYGAVRLREDYGKSVILIEKEAVLVGVLYMVFSKDLADDQTRAVTRTLMTYPRRVSRSTMGS
jgi:hypothetical protein